MFAISDGDLRKFTLGDPPDFRRYMMAVTPKSMERERMSPAAFQQLAAEGLRGFEAPPAEASILKLLEKQPVSVPLAIAELRKEPAMVSLMQGTRLPPVMVPRKFRAPEEKQNYMLSTTTLMHMRGKMINLAVFTLFDSADDVAWLRTITLRWAADLERLNSR
jgi:hypothetical protein